MADGINFECPICHEFFSNLKINAHVDICLTKEDRSPSICRSRKEGEIGDLRSQKSDEQCKPTGLIEQDIQHAGPTNRPKPGGLSHTKNINILNVLGKRSFAKPTDSLSNGEVKKIKLSPISNIRSKIIASGEKDKNEKKLLVPKMSETSAESINASRKDTQTTFSKQKGTPLAEQLRPVSFDEYFGHIDVLGNGTRIRSILESSNIPSIILWGPPGCGKTSLVNIIAANCKGNQQKRLVKLSATTSGISDVKEAVKVAKNELKLFKRETVLFIDEIHRFNKLQQDFFLPHVEVGTITLIGATTENPSFHVNGALLSRCKVIVLQKLTSETVVRILRQAVEKMSGKVAATSAEKRCSDSEFTIEEEALETLANLSDGDARSALNGLEMAMNATTHGQANSCITTSDINGVLQRNRLIYDKNGDEHYNIISALHKSIRGSDDSAALYWLARMLEGGEDPLYVARRLVRIASEDIGLADSSALQKAVAAQQACHFIGMPECDVILAHLVVYLARAPKSVEVYKAYKAAKNLINNHKGPMPGVPLHLRNAPTKLMKNLGYGKDYKYNPDYNTPVEQLYFPDELAGVNFFTENAH